jgi:hypothetical protein
LNGDRPKSLAIVLTHGSSHGFRDFMARVGSWLSKLNIFDPNGEPEIEMDVEFPWGSRGSLLCDRLVEPVKTAIEEIPDFRDSSVPGRDLPRSRFGFKFREFNMRRVLTRIRSQVHRTAMRDCASTAGGIES